MKIPTRVEIDDTGAILLAWHDGEGNTDSLYKSLEAFDIDQKTIRHFDAPALLTMHILEQEQEISDLYEVIESLTSTIENLADKLVLVAKHVGLHQET